MARHGTGASVKVRIYMEGMLLENALINLSVTGAIGSTSVAQLELVPTNTIRHILQGTWVHIFVTDPWDPSPRGDLSDFKLLFEGVVVSKGFSRQDGGRSFNVQCGDPSIYWSEAKQFWLNIASSGGNIVDQLVVAESGGYARLGTINSMGIYGLIDNRIRSKKDQPEERLMDTLISALEDIGNVNPFYANVKNRLRIMDRIIVGPAGKTVKLFQAALLSDLLEGLAGRAGGQTNMVEMINQVLSAIMHEWVAILAPPYLKTRVFSRDAYGNIKRIKTTVTREVRGTVKVDLFDYKMTEDDIIGSVIFKPHIYTVSPPTCNVLFPNMYDQMSFQENLLQEPTRLQMQPQMPKLLSGGNVGNLLQATMFHRPTELEVFQSLIRDPARAALKKRSPDAKFTDGVSQTATFSDYDWATNEERIRGIIYNFINLAPVPSTLTLADPGKKNPNGTRKQGVPYYLQNVASYEYYRAKYASRQTQVAGPLNIRPIPGFPIMVLDDSAANMNMVAYLESVTHVISASGSAMTTYGISHPRLTDEVDLNRPSFVSNKLGAPINFDLARDKDGKFNFAKMFDGSNHPAIPEWFDETFRTIEGLDYQYRQWFGPDVGVPERVLFKGRSCEEENELQDLYKQRDEYFAKNPKATLDDLPADLKDDIETYNNSIQIQETVDELNKRFRTARDTGHEFDLASTFTKRTFTMIDQAFRFVGAGPIDARDQVASSDCAYGPASFFLKNPASTRAIDYKNASLRLFIGDISSGSGYTGKPIDSDTMGPAFPVFDTELHSGAQLTDEKTRKELRDSPDQKKPSEYARYDGRPLMHDFEFRLWQESLLAAGYAPNSEKLEEASLASDYFTNDGGTIRPASPEEVVVNTEKRKAAEAKRKAAEAKRAKKGRQKSKAKNFKPSVQAPTGDGLEQEQRLPLTQPLAEKQVVELRRSIIHAYQEELARTRGFTG